ncbi:MAG: beta-ketoacyl synthase N-terminal-like domain-containing protein, partial [Candidatus Heimdallarchaeaceae archaeon]
DSISPAIQMGTAYLFTEEIVKTKALTLKYQEKMLDAFKTRVVGTTVNTRARSVPTMFTNSTLKKEFARLNNGLSISERKEAYEKDNLGALRIATKAEIWNNDHVPGGDTTQFVPVNDKQQEKLGCFMTGELATIKRNIVRIEDIHYDVTKASKQLFLSLVPELESKFEGISIEEEVTETQKSLKLENRVAIVGLGCILPDSPNIESYWKNIINKKYSITEVPNDRWEPELYYDPDPKAEYKTYSKIGAFIKDYKFNSINYRIPPKIAEKMDDVQKWSLDAAKEALEDAGIPTDGKKRLPIAVIVGNAIGGENARATNRRIFFPEVIREIKQNVMFNNLSKKEQEEFLDQLQESYSSRFPTVTEDSMPGELSNVIAGRIANVFNFTGKSMTTDAACASSVASLDTAIKALITNDFDVALVGGADRSMDVSSYVKFSKIGALSASGSRPFDSKADGFVMGEGAGFFVLKRLEDAINDGSKIYAVISSIGSSSDGKGKSITAPNPEGQKQAVLMALEKSHVNSNEIQYIEAHGTSTTVGDAVELKVLEDIFKSEQRDDKVAIGSIKSQIGHLKSAAGIAALLKTTLAIYNKTLPPTVNVDNLNPNIDWESSPLQVNTQPIEWKVKSNQLRRAGVSSFGFGGTNYHAILEEYDPQKFEYVRAEKIQIPQYIKPTPEISVTQEQLDENPICFMFTGQGSQYLGMLKRLYETSKIIADTFEEAEKVWYQNYSFSLKEIIFGSEGLTQEANSHRLTDTKFTQPALFVVDIALYRFLKDQGIKPSFVAGHSLGEYSALVAAGVLSFNDGLKAVIARGRSMSDAGKETEGAMAAVLAPIEQVEKLVKSVKDDYVIVANYNSTGQTVVSGSVSGINKIIEKASEKKITAKKLRVSTAFHSNIVENVETVMKKVLSGLPFNPPKIDVYSNVTGKKYPSQPDLIQNLLVEQICSSVRWVDEINNIYNDGGRIFVEVGPKKALFSFAKDILKEKKDVHVLNTLSPKEQEDEKIVQIVSKINNLLISKPDEPEPTHELIAPLKEIIPPTEGMDFNQYILRNKDQLHDFLRKGYELYSSYMQDEMVPKSYPTSQLETSSIGVTGVGLGIPGRSLNVFDDANIDLLLRGFNLISEIDEELKDEMLEKNIVRLVKTANGNASFEPIDDKTKVVQLAGQLGKFDPANDFGISPKLLNALDITFQLAICVGLEALKDAGIPLIRSQKKTSTGKILEGEWELPESLQDSTGIVFASAFPGYDNMVEELRKHFTSKNEEQFKREFLFKVLSMGHSQFAQLIKAKGPNTQINAACASTTQAIGIAEDWIRTGRCERVIVIAADDAANENLLPWIGAGFLAAGGISTKSKVEEAAIPFGKDRHGLIIGSAAAGLVIEKEEAYQKRGVKPIADIIGTQFTNSAFHGARLNVKHIKDQFSLFIEKIEKEKGISRNEIATEGMFVSHETYTPARGGSAEAEIESLRSVFGINASKITAGIEEGLAIKAMEKGIVPPIANISEVDPNFSDLNFSRGFEKRLKYAVRLAAGFGSQIAFTAFKLNTYEGRFDSPDYELWLNTIGGKKEGVFLEGRVLKLELSPPEEIEQLLASRKPTIKAPSSDILTEIINVIAEKTGYEPSLIEANMNLE